MLLMLGAVIIFLLLFLIGVNLGTLKEHVRYWKLIWKLPTAKGKRFFVGHALQVVGNSPAKAVELTKEWVETSEPVFTIFLGPTLVFVAVVAPEELEVVFGQMKHLQKKAGYEFLYRWLGEGLLTSSGAKWQKRRKILTPAFHFSILLEFVDIFNRETANCIREIERKHLNHPVDVGPLISDFTLLTMSETSMGTKLDLETQEGMRYKDAVVKIGDILHKRLVTPWLWYQNIFDITLLSKIEAQALDILHSFTNGIIRKRGQDFKTFDEQFGDTYTKRKHPLMDILLNAKFKDNSIDEKGIREEVDTFMFEGHDTTATSLNFSTMLFACHKDIQEEVYQEIVSIMGPDLANEPSYNDLQQMALLERCIKESLRLYPSVPMIGRTTSEEIPTKYGTIPKGACVFTLPLSVHKNPTYWPDPETFDPSRHLPENSHGRHPYAYVPFSAGPRNCIGQRFAMLEMKAFFCGLLRKFKLEPVDTPETVVVIQNLVTRSLNGVKVKFVLRT